MNAASGLELLAGIQALWCEVLGLAPGKVQPDSHFLLLGGDSLQLARLLERVQARFGVCLPLHELTRFATPLRMAACCCAVQEAVDNVVGTADLPLLTPQAVPASPVQQGIWLAEQLSAPRMLYLASVLLHFSGPLDVAALQLASAALFQRHPVLLAQLRHDLAGRCLQLHLEAEPLWPDATPLLLQDCSAAGLDAQVQQALQVPLLLEEGPLCRLRLFRLKPQRHALLLSCHHVISDGWSGSILLAQLAADYAAVVTHGSVTLQPPELGFFAYCRRIARQQESLAGEKLQWWRQRLEGMDKAQLWLWHGQCADPWPHDVVAMVVPLPADLLVRLRERAQALRQSLFTLFLYAVKAGLFACSGASRQVLLVPVAQRRQDEEACIGCFMEPLLLAGEWQPASGIEAALQAEADHFAAAQREKLPLATLAAALRPHPLPDGNPWSSIVFAFQSYPQAKLHWPALQHQVERVPERASQYALKLEILPGAEAWQLRIEYASLLLDHSCVSALAAAILVCLQQLADA